MPCPELTNEEKLLAIFSWQTRELCHPLTCGTSSSHGSLVGNLVDNLVTLSCRSCGYTQTHIPQPVYDVYRIRQGVTFTYTNWKGETGIRNVIPLRMHWGTTEFHRDPQWLLFAWDKDKDADRTFAVKDIQGWRPTLQEYHRSAVPLT